MPRYTYLLIVVIVWAGCSSFKLKEDEVAGADLWQMEGAVQARNHALTAAIDPPLERRWSFNAESGFGPGSALVYGNSILMGTRRGFLMGVHAESGKRLGRKRFDHPIEGGSVLKGNVLYIPFALGKTNVLAYDVRAGKAIWKNVGPHVEAGLLLADTTVILVDATSTVRALSQHTGEEVWHQQLDSLASVVAAPVAIGNALFVVDEEGAIARLDVRTGELKWHKRLHSPVYNTPAAGGGKIFVPTTRGRFLTVDAQTGTLAGGFSLPDTTIRFTSPAYDPHSGDLYVGATDGFLRAMDGRTGELKWQHQTGSAISAPPLITARTVYVGSMGQLLIGVDRATGVRLWEEQLDGRIRSAMAAKGNTLVVLSEPQRVYLFEQVEPPDSTTALAQSGAGVLSNN